MKIKNIKKYNNKLLKLQLLKLYYKKKSYHFKSNTNIRQVELYLNKISNIIYNYHVNNKKILFIGLPENFKKIIHKTNHILVPEYKWLNGMLNNNSSINRQKNTPNKILKLSLKLKKKLDLIVAHNLNNKSTAIKEGYITRMPVITLTTKLTMFDNKSTYESPGNFNFDNDKITNNNLFFSIIKIALKRAIKKVKKQKLFNKNKQQNKRKYFNK